MRFFIPLALLLIISFESCANLPTDVYRRDTRSPDVIFRDGFQPRGGNPNLLEHVSGASLRENSAVSLSGMVSTSASWSWVTTPRYPINTFWVYRITPGPSIFSVRESFQHYIDQRTTSQHNATYASTLLSQYGEQDEWTFLGPIQPDNIEWAARFEFEIGDNGYGTYVERERRRNPAFTIMTPAANPDYYPIIVNSPVISFRFIDAEPRTYDIRRRYTSLSMTGCWGTLFKSNRPRRSSTTHEFCADSKESHVVVGVVVKTGNVITPEVTIIHDEF